jgi:hypothetical protein
MSSPDEKKVLVALDAAVPKRPTTKGIAKIKV